MTTSSPSSPSSPSSHTRRITGRASLMIHNDRVLDMESSSWVEHLSPATVLRQLCYINRFAGAFGPYSVGHHTMNCVHIARKKGLNKKSQRAVFLHDWHEAFTGDVITWAKTYGLHQWQDHLDKEIYRKMEVSPCSAVVPAIDSLTFVSEVEHFCTRDAFPDWGIEPLAKTYGLHVTCQQTPDEVYLGLVETMVELGI